MAAVDNDMVLARFYSDGSVDTTFGSLGTGYELYDYGLWSTTASSNDEIGDIVLQNGKIVSVPLAEVANKVRTVPLDSPLFDAAEAVGMTFG